MTKGRVGDNSGNAVQQENATAMLVDLNGVRPDDPRSSTGVAFFSTNSTGQLAFLDKLKPLQREPLLECGTGNVQIFYLETKLMASPLLS